jgi:membrane protein insertase Oxa1/YidC/SpoIIIJ
MVILMPALIGWICLISQGASSLYFFTSALVAILQQKFLLNKDVEEMETMKINTNNKKIDTEGSVRQLKTKKKSTFKDKLVERATEKAKTKAFKPVEGVKIRLVGQDHNTSSTKSATTNKLRGGKR